MAEGYGSLHDKNSWSPGNIKCFFLGGAKSRRRVADGVSEASNATARHGQTSQAGAVSATAIRRHTSH